MLSGSSFWRLFLGSGGIVASVSLALGLVVLRWEERHLLDALSDRLQQVSSRVSPAAVAAIEDPNSGLLSEIAEPLARDAGLRITVVRPHGEVVFDSEGAADRVENLGTQPEIRAALSTGRGSAPPPDWSLPREWRCSFLPSAWLTPARPWVSCGSVHRWAA